MNIEYFMGNDLHDVEPEIRHFLSERKALALNVHIREITKEKIIEVLLIYKLILETDLMYARYMEDWVVSFPVSS